MYYDNVDIMEEVIQKRQRDELRVQKHHKLESKIVKDETENAKNKLEKTYIQQNLKYNISSEVKQPFDDHIDFRNALGKFEREYQQLKANNDQREEKQIPPKLPPKQIKFNRQQVNYATDKQSSSDSISHHMLGDNESKNQRLFKKQFHNRMLCSDDMRRSTSDTSLQAPVNFTIASTVQNMQEIQLLSMQECQINQQKLLSAEDARARQLVDEPLAPIIEEDSPDSESSSYASSVASDENSVFVENVLLKSSKKNAFSLLEISNLQTANKNKRNSSTGSSTESESTFAGRSSSRSSLSTNCDVIGSSGLPQKKLGQANQLDSFDNSFSNVSRNTAAQDASTSIAKKNSAKCTHPLISAAPKTKLSVAKHLLRSSESWEKALGSFSKIDETLKDVKPYGTVDLSKLQTNFREISSRDSQVMSSEEKLTRSSIVHTANHLNTFSKNIATRDSEKISNKKNTSNDFRIVVSTCENVKPDMSSSTAQRPCKNQSVSQYVVEGDQIDYDNLKNYGGLCNVTILYFIC